MERESPSSWSAERVRPSACDATSESPGACVHDRCTTVDDVGASPTVGAALRSVDELGDVVIDWAPWVTAGEVQRSADGVGLVAIV